jgi:hypothetical protein
MNRFREIYFAIWATCLPVASFVLIPSIQGTTPGNLLALASIAWLPFLQRDKARQYFKLLAAFTGICLGLFVLSQAGLFLFQNPQLPKVLDLNTDGGSALFRRTIITQSVYLVAGFLTCLFFLFCYRSEWKRYLFWGAWVLAIYGIYEWFFYLIMQRPGDFIANRAFLDGGHPGSWSQIFQFGSLSLLRIKSATGEPSFLALAGMPYLILAIENKKWSLVGALSFCLLLSFSTSAYVSVLILGVFSLIYFKAWNRRHLPLIAGFALVAVVLIVAFPTIFETVIAQKLSGKGPSGNIRQHVYLTAFEYWTQTSLWTKIFGIGFGAAFVTPWLGGILVNTGLIGVGLYCAGFAWPLMKLPNSPENWALKGSLLVLFFMLSVSVADFTYLTTWMTLGLAYRRLRQTNAPSTPRKSSRTSEGAIRSGSRIASPAFSTTRSQAPTLDR